MTIADGRQRIGEFVEQVRASAEVGSHSIRVTVRAGLAAFGADGADVESLYRAADEALYVAKAHGGDRVRVAGHGADGAGSAIDVVLVEDDAVLGDLLDHALVTRGFTTHRLADGLEAAGLLAGEDPGLLARVIVLDWDLPSMDGLRVLRELADSGTLRRTRVIMLTARATEREVLKTLEAGAFDHVAKPFSVPVLMQRIRRALEQSP
jgi:PleD family two-component response regulator